MSGISVARTRDGEALPIISPGASVGVGTLTSESDVLTSNPIQGTAIYLFCQSLIHFSADEVGPESAPVDARGGIYLDVDRLARVSVCLLAGEPAAKVWMHEVR